MDVAPLKQRPTLLRAGARREVTAAALARIPYQTHAGESKAVQATTAITESDTRTRTYRDFLCDRHRQEDAPLVYLRGGVRACGCKQ